MCKVHVAELCSLMVYGDISPKNTSTLLRILAEAIGASYVDTALET